MSEYPIDLRMAQLERQRHEDYAPLYEKDRMVAIRAGLADKRVVAVDWSGTIAGTNGIYPEAVEALQGLRQEGYTLVLWSLGSRRKFEPYLGGAIPTDMFALTVGEENMQGADFEEIVDNTPWIQPQEGDTPEDGALKEQQRDALTRIGPGAKSLNLLTREACMVEDDILSPIIHSKIHGAQNPHYPFVFIDNQGANGSTKFDLGVVDAVKAVFPPAPPEPAA